MPKYLQFTASFKIKEFIFIILSASVFPVFDAVTNIMNSSSPGIKFKRRPLLHSKMCTQLASLMKKREPYHQLALSFCSFRFANRHHRYEIEKAKDTAFSFGKLHL